MISDEKLKRISLVLALVGLVLIYVVVLLIEPQIVAVKDLDEKDVGKQVLLNGTILSYRTSDGHVFIEVTDGTGNITTVMFERAARNQKRVYDLKKGDKITVNGQVSVYKSEIEIIANSITFIKTSLK